MFMEERQQKILHTLREKGRITTAEIAEEYNVSTESARRDLRMLEKQGFCVRTHGGAVVTEDEEEKNSVKEMKDMPYQSQTDTDVKYENIAIYAAQQIKEGDCILISNGSLCEKMTRHLPRDIRYTVYLYNPYLSPLFESYDNITLCYVKLEPEEIAPGKYEFILAGTNGEALGFDKIFITANIDVDPGTDEEFRDKIFFLDLSLLEVTMLKLLIRASEQCIYLISSRQDERGTGMELGMYDMASTCIITDDDWEKDEMISLSQLCRVIYMPVNEE